MKNNNSSGNGAVNVNFSCDLLGLAFVILKLCNVIHWKWIWVLCPFWIGAAILIIGILIILIISGETPEPWKGWVDEIYAGAKDINR